MTKNKRQTKIALEHLADYLRWYHPKYSIDNVEPTQVRGYLQCTKPCSCTYPPFDGYTIGLPRGEHYHSIEIGWMYRPGFGRGPYAFWRAVCTELNARKAERD